jgi:hypothetical protein
MATEDTVSEQTGSTEVPTVNPLIPDGIDKFVPSCVVCRNPVPAKRATGRSKDTCSPECNKVLRQYRKHVLVSTRCPACYHPSTPEERREFIQWRKWRGDRRERRGRPGKKPTLAKLLDKLQQYPGEFGHLSSEERALILDVMQEANIASACEREAFSVDTSGQSQSTLPPSGQSA